MDRILIFKILKDKPALLLNLYFENQSKSWILQDCVHVDKFRKRMAFEVENETLSNDKELNLFEEGKLRVEFCKKKKIKFTAEGLKSFQGEYIFYIPSWGFNTEKKIWVLIPSHIM